MECVCARVPLKTNVQMLSSVPMTYESTLFMKGTNKHVDNIPDLGGRPPAHRG